VATAIASWSPGPLPPGVASFARKAVAESSPVTPARARSLLYAASRLGSFVTSVGLSLERDVVLSASVIERFILCESPRLSAPTLRTLRSNLRYIARSVLINQVPAPVPLSRERAKAPYARSEIHAYLALADAQPTYSRQMRLQGLVALGAGAGLMGADLRGVRGTDVICRSGGVVVSVEGKRPRMVPVRGAFCERLLCASQFAGSDYIIGGFSAARKNVTSGLVASVAGGLDLPTLETARLRATWLVACAQAIGLDAFMTAAGITCSQRLGDLVDGLVDTGESRSVALLS
jgi:hypothetical protein